MSRLKNADSWFHFGVTLVLAVILAVFSLSFLIESSQQIRSNTLKAETLEESNQARLNKITSVRSKSASLEQTADSLLKGLIKTEQEEPDLSALEAIGIHLQPSFFDDSSARFTFRSNALEYHALVPALSAQEKLNPLMRYSRLTLRTTQKPFRPSAIPLQVELELAFPKEIKPADATPKPPQAQ